MIRQIAPQFFTMEMAATLAYYKDKRGFDCVGTWDDPPVYAIVATSTESISASPTRPSPIPINTSTSSANRRITSITQAAFPNTEKRSGQSARGAEGERHFQLRVRAAATGTQKR
jgi:hypothetical protein